MAGAKLKIKELVLKIHSRASYTNTVCGLISGSSSGSILFIQSSHNTRLRQYNQGTEGEGRRVVLTYADPC